MEMNTCMTCDGFLAMKQDLQVDMVDEPKWESNSKPTLVGVICISEPLLGVIPEQGAFFI